MFSNLVMRFEALFDLSLPLRHLIISDFNETFCVNRTGKAIAVV